MIRIGAATVRCGCCCRCRCRFHICRLSSRVHIFLKRNQCYYWLRRIDRYTPSIEKSSSLFCFYICKLITNSSFCMSPREPSCDADFSPLFPSSFSNWLTNIFVLYDRGEILESLREMLLILRILRKCVCIFISHSHTHSLGTHERQATEIQDSSEKKSKAKQQQQ